VSLIAARWSMVAWASRSRHPPTKIRYVSFFALSKLASLRYRVDRRPVRPVLMGLRDGGMGDGRRVDGPMARDGHVVGRRRVGRAARPSRQPRLFNVDLARSVPPGDHVDEQSTSVGE
jgi:hypothetical protein